MSEEKENFCHIGGTTKKISNSEVKKYIEKYLSLEENLYLVKQSKKSGRKLGFTIGMNKLFNLPEILAMAPEIEMVANLLKLTSQYLKDKKEKKEKITHGTVIDDLLLFNIKVCLIDVSEHYKKKFMKEIYDIYGNWNFEVQQVLITDPEGNFPWNKNYNPNMEIIQTVFGDISGIS
jgi:hypothetical protein